ncbi:LolA-like outer membrane lipoprotein chaperone [Campylobacter sp.]|uniref:LolA-like outer membrane lipoprotein chaperone n=1 Tax=Campylobacter sp. TaxID=205 RepID=UPI0025BDD0A7|nr:LolA-like outer membrane lipoprotein chaperone [Campylobacter sp.]
MKYLFIFIFTFSQLLAFDINFKNFSSDFIQKVYNNNSFIEYKGTFIITQDKAFWNYIYPNSKQIYINKHKIVIIEPQLEQVIFTKIQNLPNLQQIFKKAKKINNDLYEADYENIKYKINLKNNQISSISYVDELQNLVTTSLFNQKIDEKIDEKIFIPNFPNHYDVINN